MSRTDVAAFPAPPASARRVLDATRDAAAAGDWDTVGTLAPPLLGQPALHAEALLLLLEAARMTGDTAAALLYAGRAARIAPQSPRALGLLAMAQNEAGRLTEALATALAAREMDPDDAVANSAACLAALRLGRPDAAVSAAKALADTPYGQPEAAALAKALLEAAGPEPARETDTDEADAPRPTTLIAPKSGPRPQGAVRCDAAGRLRGHLVDEAGDRDLTVALVDDAGRRMTVPAREFDPDLLALGHGDGRHAFTVAWPHADQSPCSRVTARCAETGDGLAGSPVLVPHAPFAAEALARLAAWLRQAAGSPDAPPPLPPECRGPVLDLARHALAGLVADMDASLAGPEDDAGDADA